jgi:hypothetical protein
MTTIDFKNRTNVRFHIGWLACATTGLGACAAMPPRTAERGSCELGLRAICTAFGPTRSCECVPRAEVDRFLQGLGTPAVLDGIR